MIALHGPALSTRRPANTAEGAFFDAANREGWVVTKRGWPDFACWKDGRFIAVEVKPTPNHKNLLGVSQPQQHVMAALAEHGVQVYRWDPIGGFSRVDPG